jgi:hypothetical protein
MAWARRGPPGAAVAELTAADGDAEEACCAGFELRPSA